MPNERIWKSILWFLLQASAPRKKNSGRESKVGIKQWEAQFLFALSGRYLKEFYT